MIGATRAAMLLLVPLGAASGAVLLTNETSGTRTSRGAAAPPSAAMLGCSDRITGAFIRRGDKIIKDRFAIQPERDTIIGPLAFRGLAAYGPSTWRWTSAGISPLIPPPSIASTFTARSLASPCDGIRFLA